MKKNNEAEKVTDIEENNKASVGTIIFCSIFAVIMVVVCAFLYRLYDAKTYNYDIDAVYYTEHALVPQLYKAKIAQRDGKNIVMGNGLIPICNIEIQEIERPVVKLGCSNLLYLYKNYGIKVTKINEDDEMLTDAGIQVGDYIQRIENEYIDTPEEVGKRVADFPTSHRIYTIVKQGKYLNTVYLDSSKKLSFEGEEANANIKAIGFTLGNKCYTYGTKGIKEKPIYFVNFKAVNYAKGYAEITNKNSLDLYTEEILNNEAKLESESNYGVIFKDMQGNWKEGRDIEIGFAWEIEPSDAVVYVVNKNSGECEERKIVISRERVKDEEGMVFNKFEGLEVTKEMLGAPVVQNNRLVGFVAGEGIFIAADKVYVMLNF